MGSVRALRTLASKLSREFAVAHDAAGLGTMNALRCAGEASSLSLRSATLRCLGILGWLAHRPVGSGYTLPARLVTCAGCEGLPLWGGSQLAVEIK